MEKVIQSLQENKNALLESPTGTGKTLCLLCSTLAWRKTWKPPIREPFGDTDNRTLLDGMYNEDAEPQRPPPIIYSSRTHSQLTQVIGELKKNCPYAAKTCILGSRKQLCIHPEVSLLKGEARDHKCRSLVTATKCDFHKNVDDYKNDATVTEKVCDIEDLLQLGAFNDCLLYTSDAADE
eukprot:TRINITY_DN2799_c0_g1_i1.p1 TRINITY_DN2799_c0_g1~~TRINITY_DN2799_c0_g1_i1.p1  ORF type:complete len:203 (-),score=24.67 TRINITY_DN2799_c0_g1_i1:12-551(-)